MIRNISFTNYLGESLTVPLSWLSLREPVSLINATGLGPEKAIISTSEVATIDGAFINNIRVGYRNIVFTFIFNWITTIEEARHESYLYFPVKKPIKIVIETDTRTLETEGYVESNDVSIFSDTCGSTVSVICPDPYFYEQEPRVSELYSIGRLATADFRFPIDHIFAFGNIIASSYIEIIYLGDVDTGINIEVLFNDYVGNITFTHTETNETMFIDTSIIATLIGVSRVQGGDSLYINTRKGKKSVNFVHNGNVYNVINAVSTASTWFQLTPGANTFALSTDTGNEKVDVKFYYNVCYEGV